LGPNFCRVLQTSGKRPNQHGFATGSSMPRHHARGACTKKSDFHRPPTAPQNPIRSTALSKCFKRKTLRRCIDKRGLEAVCLRISFSCAQVNNTPAPLGSWCPMTNLIPAGHPCRGIRVGRPFSVSLRACSNKRPRRPSGQCQSVFSSVTARKTTAGTVRLQKFLAQSTHRSKSERPRPDCTNGGPFAAPLDLGEKRVASIELVTDKKTT